MGFVLLIQITFLRIQDMNRDSGYEFRILVTMVDYLESILDGSSMKEPLAVILSNLLSELFTIKDK